MYRKRWPGVFGRRYLELDAADTNAIARMQDGLLDTLAVDEYAVQAAEIG